MNLQARILLPIVAMLLFLVSSFGVISYQTTSDSLHAAIIDDMRGEAEAMERALSALITSSEASVLRLANTDRMHAFLGGDVTNPVEQAAITKLLAYYAKFFLDFESFTVLGLDGKVLASSDATSVATDYSFQEIFANARGGGLQISKPAKSPTSKTSVASIACPITKDGVVIGVLLAALNFDRFFSTNVVPVTLGSTGYAFVLTADGLVCMHSKQDRILNPMLSSASALKPMLAIKSPLRK